MSAIHSAGLIHATGLNLPGSSARWLRALNTRASSSWITRPVRSNGRSPWPPRKVFNPAAGGVATSRLISTSVSGVESPVSRWVRTGVLPVISPTYSDGRQYRLPSTLPTGMRAVCSAVWMPLCGFAADRVEVALRGAVVEIVPARGLHRPFDDFLLPVGVAVAKVNHVAALGHGAHQLGRAAGAFGAVLRAGSAAREKSHRAGRIEKSLESRHRIIPPFRSACWCRQSGGA